ncbi:aminoglycoside-2''-adenylyltransferase [Longilinea arvoryzae]|uniref:Aminoglycoside-2''-adenylyltransferase n=1 Tax=Longilinea arvoryzae TaxID=360412 RepID=A0A0S7BD22_9CHLR|nr:nucleotidyltransferase family protein [Longilinea arvoryzae]GAP12612.1 aminoglycoside-2''-adenylyltransferase [Longilinea arvoryzae]
MDQSDPEMTAQDVIEFVGWMEDNGIEVILDGGWAVDAQLGRVTRRHADLDIAMQHADTPRLRDLLAGRGYSEVPLDDSWECNFVLGDAEGHRIDVHSYTFDANGKLVHGVPYPFDSLLGQGTVGGKRVRCITPEWLVKFHTGYAIDENDYRDVRALCRHFGLPIPDEFSAYVKNDIGNWGE